MKTEELEQELKKIENDFEIKFSIYKRRDELRVMLINDSGRTSDVFTIGEYKILDFKIHYGFDYLEDEAKDKLFKLLYKYTSTPPKDRKPIKLEKTYYLEHKWIGKSHFANYLIFYGPIEENDPYLEDLEQASYIDSSIFEFTEKQIEQIKQKYNTDLKGFEMVEVKNDIIWTCRRI